MAPGGQRNTQLRTLRHAWRDPEIERLALSGPILHEDFRDLLLCLEEARVRFLIVGAHALAVHGVPRATGDIDVLVAPEPRNAERLIRALEQFGAPIESHGVSQKDFEEPGRVYQMGLPPRRIDVMTSIEGVDFSEAERSAVRAEVDGLVLPVLGRAQLLANKLATGRPKDLVDAKLLQDGAEAE